VEELFATYYYGRRIFLVMVTFESEAYEEIIQHAREGKPHEICGVLGGERHEDEARVEFTRRVENVSETPRVNYLMEPEDQLEAIDDVEDRGEVIGFYHSHPEGPEEPSETDAARANWPDHSYVIVSLGPDEPFVGSWIWTGERFEEEEVVVDSD
jgi:proteasome lid subunit RPN8/RPN11